MFALVLSFTCEIYLYLETWTKVATYPRFQRAFIPKCIPNWDKNGDTYFAIYLAYKYERIPQTESWLISDCHGFLDP